MQPFDIIVTVAELQRDMRAEAVTSELAAAIQRPSVGQRITTAFKKQKEQVLSCLQAEMVERV